MTIVILLIVAVVILRGPRKIESFEIQSPPSPTPQVIIPQKVPESNFTNCPSCRFWIPKETARCPECGTNLKEEVKYGKYCNNCGEKIPEDENVCPKCDLYSDEDGNTNEITISEVLPPELFDEDKEDQPFMDLCPSCGNRVANDDLMCPVCDFYFGSS